MNLIKSKNVKIYNLIVITSFGKQKCLEIAQVLEHKHTLTLKFTQVPCH